MDIFFTVSRLAAEDADLADAIARSGRVVLFESVGRQQLARDEIVQTREPIAPLRRCRQRGWRISSSGHRTGALLLDVLRHAQGQTPTLPAVAPPEIHARAHQDWLVSAAGDAPGCRPLQTFRSMLRPPRTFDR